MIAWLRGRVVQRGGEGIVLDVGGVGYGLAMSLAGLEGLALGDETALFVHTHVGQETLRLYGFTDAEERSVFEVLIGTSRVGPKLALAILSTFSPAALRQAVGGGDAPALVRVPGVGKKTAERLVLELRDRLGADAPPLPHRGDLLSDLRSALENLGFPTAQSDKLARATLEDERGQEDIAALMRAALRKA